MKKFVYLLTSVLVAPYSVEAGKYFDYLDDGTGGKKIVFHKSGKKFNRALAELRKFAANPRHIIDFVNQGQAVRLNFHEDISDKQKIIVQEALGRQIDGFVHEDGKIDTRTSYEVHSQEFFDKNKKKEGTYFKEECNVDLTHKGMSNQYVFAALDKADSATFDIQGMKKEDWKDLKIYFSGNNAGQSRSAALKKIYIEGNENNQTKIEKLIGDLLFIPAEVEFYFSESVLKKLSVKALPNKEKLSVKALPNKESVEKGFSSIKIMPSVSAYLDYGCFHMQNYRDVCEDSTFCRYFKPSWVHYANEKTQKNSLVQILKGGLSLVEQAKLLDTIKQKETHKTLHFHENSFVRIDALIKEQRSLTQNEARYSELQTEKETLIKKILSQM